MAYSTDAAGNKTIEPVFEKIMYGADGWINDNLMQTGSIHDLVLDLCLISTLMIMSRLSTLHYLAEAVRVIFQSLNIIRLLME